MRSKLSQGCRLRMVSGAFSTAGLLLLAASLALGQTQPGQQGDWGQAGPPPDAQNGRIPAQPPDGSAQTSGVGVPPESAQPAEPNGAGDQTAPPPPVGPGAAPAAANPYRAPYRPSGRGDRQAALPPSGPVTVAAGVLLRVRTTQPLDMRSLQPGDYFDGAVARDVYVGNVLAIPRGADIMGEVVAVKKSGELKGSSGLSLAVTSLELGGRTYPLATTAWSAKGPGKGLYTAGNTAGGAALGAVIGAIAGGGAGAAVGAVAGGTLGLGASAATSGPHGVIPPETLLTFRLTQPATVQPVSLEEARSLARSSEPLQPRRRMEPAYPPYYAPYYPPYYGPGPYAYAYPYPYAYAYPYPYPYPYARYYRFHRWR